MAGNNPDNPVNPVKKEPASFLVRDWRGREVARGEAAPDGTIALDPLTPGYYYAEVSESEPSSSESLVTCHSSLARLSGDRQAGNQTLVFWRESDVDTGRRSDASLADKDFTIPAADGEYRLVDVMGTPSAIAAACLPGAVRAQAPAVQSSPQRHT
ncbi:MAG: hypothetical protein IJP66_00625 [Kiritimatiellae bacterium]|nr:hypothetical protein [Kiritimatiellia bacterium]